jgi:hypothetical protein
MLFVVFTTQSYMLAQDGKGKLPKGEKTQRAVSTQAEMEKIETSGGGPKIETRYRPTLGAAVNSEASKTEKASGLGVPNAVSLSATKKTAQTFDVGVIPGANGCPANSELITIYMDDEDDHNANGDDGWIGATVQGGNTGFKFCRVDGTTLPIISGAAYAVIQLDTTCPKSAAAVFSRKFSNEKHKNRNSWSGSIDPNYTNKTQANSQLVFCLMSDVFNTNGITKFPNLGVEYGVFAASDFPEALASGYIHIDDEDEKNENSYGGSYDQFYSLTSRIISGNLNTDIRFVKVNSGAPVYGSLHSVSLNRTSVKGGSSCSDIEITVYLDGPCSSRGADCLSEFKRPAESGNIRPKVFHDPRRANVWQRQLFYGYGEGHI